jgi:hypothetical protein
MSVAMTSKEVRNQLWFWSFILVDEAPGPSVRDARELIRRLGFDRREFWNVEMIKDSCGAHRHITELAATGRWDMILPLRDSYDRAAKAPTISPQLVTSAQPVIDGETHSSARNAVVELQHSASSAREICSEYELNSGSQA